MGCGSSTEKYATSDYGQYLAKAAAEEVPCRVSINGGSPTAGWLRRETPMKNG